MRTWWIDKINGVLHITELSALHLNNCLANYPKSLGPYFSYKEAMNVLYVWSK